MKIELAFYIVAFLLETVLIKYAVGVDSWLMSMFLAATVGAALSWVILHVPDILD